MSEHPIAAAYGEIRRLRTELDRKDEEIAKMESLLKKWGALKGQDVVEAARKATAGLNAYELFDVIDELREALRRHDEEG